jgi:hypothetical protein
VRLDRPARSARTVRGTHLIEAASTQQPIGLFVVGCERAIQESEYVRRDEGSEQKR